MQPTSVHYLEHYKQEQNRLVRAWIWLWYSTLFRFLFVLLPGHFLVTLPLLHWAGVSGEILRGFAQLSYVFVLAWAILDNDFDTQLRRIGLDVNRRPLPRLNTSA